jgi:hypothetical protein
MEPLTNRVLAQAFGVSLTQVKRWAVICLGRDPEADQAGGVRREYSVNEAFMIYLFGDILVGKFRMGLKQAKVHMDNIKPQLIEEKLLPSNLDYELPINIIKLMPMQLLDKYKDIIKQRPFINLIIFGENDYLIEWGVITSIDDVKIVDKHYTETYSIRKYFPEQFPMSIRDGQQYVIELDVYLLLFAELF